MWGLGDLFAYRENQLNGNDWNLSCLPLATDRGSWGDLKPGLGGIHWGDYRSRLWNRYKADSDVFEIDPSCPSPLRIST